VSYAAFACDVVCRKCQLFVYKLSEKGIKNYYVVKLFAVLKDLLAFQMHIWRFETDVIFMYKENTAIMSE